ncbi:uncharacterized protein LOC113521502 [Galleria mellonella]|uniref:Uncharacterized protein LOC113521502 n=1 Tax=Galleria mellonella TaxID=7137 RepID=A0A6J1X7M7_GALME|nr:uncharacterized protein LOC113521502 [Galleria mellonella]
MGCTSSAPNMVTSHTNTTEKLLQFPEESHKQSIVDVDVHTNNGIEDIENKVLPSCDTLDESIQLDRHNKSVINISNMDIEKDTHANGFIIKNEDIVDKGGDDEDKLSTLQEVVEKVVELYVTDNAFEMQNFPEEKKIVEEETKINSIKKEESHRRPDEEPLDVPKTDSDNVIHDTTEEAISPSQSTSSRATRWEALADIAAELPPSLTVDPITGQIYALSK